MIVLSLVYTYRVFSACGKTRRFLAKRNDFPLLCAIYLFVAIPLSKKKKAIELSGVACAVEKLFLLPNLGLSSIIWILLRTNNKGRCNVKTGWPKRGFGQMGYRYFLICKCACRENITCSADRMPPPWWNCLCIHVFYWKTTIIQLDMPIIFMIKCLNHELHWWIQLYADISRFTYVTNVFYKQYSSLPGGGVIERSFESSILIQVILSRCKEIESSCNSISHSIQTNRMSRMSRFGSLTNNYWSRVRTDFSYFKNVSKFIILIRLWEDSNPGPIIISQATKPLY